jgi:phage-related protein
MILYLAITGRTFLLYAFTKKKQKTDKKEIDIAMFRLKEFRSSQAK